MDKVMNANVQMRDRIRDHITVLSAQYSHGDESRRGRNLRDQIYAVERARSMWLLTWQRYGDTDEQTALRYYVTGVNATLRNEIHLSKGARQGWLDVQAFAQDVLRLSST